MNQRLISILLLAQFATASVVLASDFESQVAPLLIRRCVECHQGTDPSGGLSLTSEVALRSGGDSGDVIDVQSPGDTLLLERVHAGEMPPEKQGQPQKLSDNEIAVLSNWIRSGAKWPKGRELDFFERTNEDRAGRDWWSLQPIQRPEIPDDAKNSDISPIDYFIRERLDQADMVPAPQATPAERLRRLHYVLIGLPPTRSEIEAFEKDPSDEAWEQNVDRLLESPQYGVRWGRYWLDLARYADTSGYERDQAKPFAWKYRDWVVDALNSDMPYDKFIIHQLAGDEIENRTETSTIATGFLRLGTWNDEPNDPADYVYDRLEDMVHTTSSTFIGMTVKCARCHAHKFDAITQEDYYRMASVFWPGPVKLGDEHELGGPKSKQLGFQEVLGWTDLSPNPPALHVLKNGERDKPLNAVVPASLSFLPKLERPFDSPRDSKTTKRRLQLARWIASPENPLTPRVLVNRIWQHHFGNAIVRTPSNFGFLADPPTHPRLLDWLASELIAGDWKIKRIHKMILTSKTWQQSSLHPQEEKYKLADAANRLCWRSERRRLDAESLRDKFLFSTGELDTRLKGDGFRPLISNDALEGLSRKAKAWTPSPAKDRLRRSLYAFTKRGLLPPMMTTFDMCDTSQTCGQRDSTTVPTQALALLNNRFTHERSTTLATSIDKLDEPLAKKVKLVWSHILSRKPTSDELALGIDHITRQKSQIESDITHRIEASNENNEAQPVLHLRADAGVETDQNGNVSTWKDQVGKHDATQLTGKNRPRLKPNAFNEQPAIIFDGAKRFLHVANQVVNDQAFTIVVVASDLTDNGHREIISNWNGSAGNSTTSIFLGLTGESTIRFSDSVNTRLDVAERRQPFIITASSGKTGNVRVNGRAIYAGDALPTRKLDTNWVIGQQGNINGEYWNGGIAEVMVFANELSDSEIHPIEQQLATRYRIDLDTEIRPRESPEVMALASLVHVLFNSNEFLYVD